MTNWVDSNELLTLSVKDQVYGRLKADLILGGLRPGRFLQEKQLAQKFGVSKTPVREALAELVKDRLVQVFPRKGYWITPIDPREIREVLEFRLILEGAAAERAAEYITEKELDNLEGLLQAQPVDRDSLSDPEEIARYGKANIRFHVGIAVASRSRPLVRAHAQVMDEMTRAIFLSYSFPRMSETAHDHAEIVAALRDHDARRARATLTRHLEASGRRLIAGLMGERAGLIDLPVETW